MSETSPAADLSRFRLQGSKTRRIIAQGKRRDASAALGDRPSADKALKGRPITLSSTANQPVRPAMLGTVHSSRFRMPAPQIPPRKTLPFL
jgi:hypothetical protein